MDLILGGRYRAENLLGTGGGASVYQASDESLGRDVAIKMFAPATADDDDYRRQHTEMQLLATLNHPGLVTLHDAGLHKDETGAIASYLVMELVDGADLRQWLKSGPLTRGTVAELGADLADALNYIHQNSVIHRDVKPANILLSGEGEQDTRLTAKLTDFGIAKVMESTLATARGAALGTANYLSPEQAEGLKVTVASDIYSLGLVLLECLTGEKAFPGPVVEAAVARLLRDPEVPSSLGEYWCDLLDRMTRRNPDERPTAHEVALALREWWTSPDAEHTSGNSSPESPHARHNGDPGHNGHSNHPDDPNTGGSTTGNVHIPSPPNRAPRIGTRRVSWNQRW